MKQNQKKRNFSGLDRAEAISERLVYGLLMRGRSRNRLFVLNPDLIDGRPRFEGHSFCQEGITDPGFLDDSIWFFGPFAKDTSQAANTSYFTDINPSAYKQDQRYKMRDSAFIWDCDVAQYFTLPDAQHNLTITTGFDAGKWFHRKTAGFTAIKDMFSRQLLYQRPHRVSLLEKMHGWRV